MRSSTCVLLRAKTSPPSLGISRWFPGFEAIPSGFGTSGYPCSLHVWEEINSICLILYPSFPSIRPVLIIAPCQMACLSCLPVFPWNPPYQHASRDANKQGSILECPFGWNLTIMPPPPAKEKEDKRASNPWVFGNVLPQFCSSLLC